VKFVNWRYRKYRIDKNAPLMSWLSGKNVIQIEFRIAAGCGIRYFPAPRFIDDNQI
jgi:hypothetical protein